MVYWISRSEENAASYVNSVWSEFSKYLRVLIDGGRAGFVSRETGEPIDVLSDIKEKITPQKRTLDIATDCGLLKVYDLVYRQTSMEVHGKMFNVLLESDDGEAISAKVPAFASLLRAIVLIVNERLNGRGTTAKEILQMLNVDRMAGE